MNQHFARAQVLMSQERYDQARGELVQALALEPNEPLYQALLSFCLTELKNPDEALVIARQAIHAGPDIAFCHYALAHALYAKDRFAQAEMAIREAIRLEPENAQYLSQLAGVLLQLTRPQDALDAANEGLERDPDDEGCLNLRAMALTQLGRKDEAATTIRGALQKNPDNAVSHANLGWTSLHRGENKAALEHFREALRLDPTSDWARQGLVEALKARYLIYRIMLAYFLWISRLSSGAQWAVIIGGYVGHRILGSISRSNPEFAPFVLPLQIAYLVFALMTWLASPLFEAVLLLNRYGRHALLPPQRASAIALLAMLAGAGLLLGAYFGLDEPLFLVAAAVLAALTIPVSLALRHIKSRGRVILGSAAMALVLVGALLIASFVVPIMPPGTLITIFILGIIGYQVLANWVMIHRQ